MALTQQTVLQYLANWHDDYLGQSLAELNVLKTVESIQQGYCVKLRYPYPFESQRQQFEQQLSEYLSEQLNESVTVTIEWKIANHTGHTSIQCLKQVKNIIAIASGKGGVGKSTVAVNLACALQKEGGRVGLLDADIYGPNQPQMLGQRETHLDKPQKNAIPPVEAFGLQTMSIGYLVDSQQPTIWRGPMVSGALQQLLNQTQWDNLDYLIIDLPPGTGDIQLTLAQKIPVSGSIIVTTPQQVALADARKGLAMFNKVRVPVLGLVENMSYFICDHCEHRHHLFDQDGGRALAKQHNIDLLGQVPLQPALVTSTEQGRPLVYDQPESPVAKEFSQIACHLAANLSQQAINYSAKFTNIVVEND